MKHFTVPQVPGSKRNASKGLGTFREQYKDLWVVPVVEVVKKTKRAPAVPDVEDFHEDTPCLDPHPFDGRSAATY